MGKKVSNEKVQAKINQRPDIELSKNQTSNMVWSSNTIRGDQTAKISNQRGDPTKKVDRQRFENSHERRRNNIMEEQCSRRSQRPKMQTLSSQKQSGKGYDDNFINGIQKWFILKFWQELRHNLGIFIFELHKNTQNCSLFIVKKLHGLKVKLAFHGQHKAE